MEQDVLIYGVDGVTTYAVTVDSVGNLRVKDAKGNPRGWMYTRYVKSLNNTSLAAGTNDINDAAIGAGYAMSMKWASFMYIGTIATVRIQLRLYAGATTILLGEQIPIVSNQLYSYNFNIPMIAADYMGIRIFNATLNDDAYLYLVGESAYD